MSFRYKTEINYLGYQVSEKGIRPSIQNIEAVLDYPIPRNTKQVHRFVGLASYFRRFIAGFSVLAKPLYDMLKKDTKFEFGQKESRYHSFELECLAVVYAIKRFRIYLTGIKFKIITDCDSFLWNLGKRNVNPRISRWALFLKDYDCDIVHRPENKMSHVDALSRCNGINVIEANTFDETLSIH